MVTNVDVQLQWYSCSMCKCCILKRLMSIGSVLCVGGGSSSRSNVACGSGRSSGNCVGRSSSSSSSSSDSNLHNYSFITLTINACDIGFSLVE